MRSGDSASAIATARRLARYAWAAPTTALGLAVVVAGGPRARLRIVDGVIEAHGPALSTLLASLPLVPGGAAALTLGHVVIGRNAQSLESTRGHERVHVRQCERWGPLLVPAYLAAGAWAMLRGRDAYLDNVFEREAYRDAPAPKAGGLRGFDLGGTAAQAFRPPGSGTGGNRRRSALRLLPVPHEDDALAAGIRLRHRNGDEAFPAENRRELRRLAAQRLPRFRRALEQSVLHPHTAPPAEQLCAEAAAGAFD